jgi:hypothetical protein
MKPFRKMILRRPPCHCWQSAAKTDREPRPAQSRALSQGRIMLMTALVEGRLRDAGLECRARYMPWVTETGDDWIEIVKVEGGTSASTCLRGWRFGVRRYQHDDDGKVATLAASPDRAGSGRPLTIIYRPGKG